MSEVFQMYRLSSTRQLALLRQQNNVFNEICIFGNVDYNNTRGDLATPLAVDAISKWKSIKQTEERNEKRGASELESQTFMDLTYSKQESYSIASLCLKRDVRINLYEQDNAS